MQFDGHAIRLLQARPTDDERDCVEQLLGAPSAGWDGGPRTQGRDRFTAAGGRSQRERRHLLLPALQALQYRVGWISEGGLNHVCERLGIPPAEAWSVATFYAQLATSPRPRRVVHVCDDVACRARGAKGLCEQLERAARTRAAARRAGGPRGARGARSGVDALALPRAVRRRAGGARQR